MDDYFYNFFDSIKNKPDEIEKFRQSNPCLIDLLHLEFPASGLWMPIPLLHNIRSIQATLFDNGRHVKHTLLLKVWNRQKNWKSGPHWQGSSRLFTQKQALPQLTITSKRSTNFDPTGILNKFNSLFEKGNNHVGWVIGNTKRSGVHYFKDYFVGAKIDDNQMISELTFYSPHTIFDLNGFVNFYANGNSLPSNIKCESRTAFDPNLNKWYSKLIEEEIHSVII